MSLSSLQCTSGHRLRRLRIRLPRNHPRFRLATIQFTAVEVEAMITPFDNGLGCTLDVHRVGKPWGW
jgi:hypothetical protein